MFDGLKSRDITNKSLYKKIDEVSEEAVSTLKMFEGLKRNRFSIPEEKAEKFALQIIKMDSIIEELLSRVYERITNLDARKIRMSVALKSLKNDDKFINLIDTFKGYAVNTISKSKIQQLRMNADSWDFNFAYRKYDLASNTYKVNWLLSCVLLNFKKKRNTFSHTIDITDEVTDIEVGFPTYDYCLNIKEIKKLSHVLYCYLEDLKFIGK